MKLGSQAEISQVYDFSCYRDIDKMPDLGFTYWGDLLVWRDGFKNTVPTEGLNKYLDATIKTGLTSPAWYVGLKGTGSMFATDTLASHTGWSEVNVFSGNKPVFTAGTISGGSVDNTSSKASFSINGTATVAGAFMASASTGTSGTLLGEGDFGASRGVQSGDTLNVTVTCSLTSS